VSGEEIENRTSRAAPKGTPRHLSQQLGISVQDVLLAIEYARLEPEEDVSGQIEYDLKSVVAAYLDQTRQRESEQNNQLQVLLRSCLDAYQDSVRQMIREENRVAYQIKDMTESRFLEVLGQVSLSLGRVEAFVMQAAKLLSQIDMRLARSESQLGLSPQSGTQTNFHTQSTAHVQSAAQPQGHTTATTQPPAQTQPSAQLPSHSPSQNSQIRPLSNAEHWREFEVELTRVLAANGDMAESAIADWLSSAKTLLNFGSLELRLNGEHLLGGLRPALLGNSFAGLHFSLPADDNILPAFENFQAWVNAERARGHSAILLFLVLILNRGPQISWSGFVTTFVNQT